MVQSLHAVDVSTLINFLPVMFNQLFRLLTKTHSDDVALNSVKYAKFYYYFIQDSNK